MSHKEGYYTPEISDFYIGYEFEFRSISTAQWGFSVYKEQWHNYDEDCNIQDYFDIDAIRVPYLTKEDIEREGWCATTILIEDDEEDTHHVDGFEKYTKSKDRWYTLEQFPNNRIKIVLKYYNNSVSQIWKTLFEGECKSVNEFRTVCKLLGI